MAVSRNVIFRVGQSRAIVSVPITDDHESEPDKTFTAMISEIVDYPSVTIIQPTTQVTIQNDDGM